MNIYRLGNGPCKESAVICKTFIRNKRTVSQNKKIISSKRTSPDKRTDLIFHLHDNDVVIHDNDVVIHDNDVVIHDNDVVIHDNDVVIHDNDVVIGRLSFRI